MARPSRPACLPGGAKFATAPNVDMAMVAGLWARPDAFVSMCTIQMEEEGLDFLTPTLAQQAVIKAYHEHRWNMVVKYRQAKITTISVLLMLRDCMYLEGVKGLLVAEKQDTAEDVFERIQLAYKHLPDGVKMPLAKGRRPGSRSIHFEHGGNIKIITAGSKSPAVGRSVDRLIITEFGEVQWQANAAMQIFPTLSKRPNARVILESTTGKAGSHFEIMWRKALENKGRFNPVFLEWWRDNTCAYSPKGFSFTPDELELLKRMKGSTRRQLAFRQAALDTEFIGDDRLFSTKYPLGPYDGWIGSHSPVLPYEEIRALLDVALDDPPPGEHGCHEIEAPHEHGYYVITADPAGYGAKGDNSALTVWDAAINKEVAFWEGREDPGVFARRLLRVQARYRVKPSRPENAPRNWIAPRVKVLLAVESNAAACIAALRELGATNLMWTNRAHPGWYATDKKLYEAEAKLVKLIRESEITIVSRGMLHQLLDYDGSRKKRIRSSSGETQHFDRARTAVMFADISCTRNFVKEMRKVTSVRIERPAGTVSVQELDRRYGDKQRQANNPYAPPPSDWM